MTAVTHTVYTCTVIRSWALPLPTQRTEAGFPFRGFDRERLLTSSQSCLCEPVTSKNATVLVVAGTTKPNRQSKHTSAHHQPVAFRKAFIYIENGSKAARLRKGTIILGMRRARAFFQRSVLVLWYLFRLFVLDFISAIHPSSVPS